MSHGKVMWGCLALRTCQRAVWKSTMMGNGEQCVTTTGTWLTPRCCVASSTSLEPNLLWLGRTTDKVAFISTDPPPEGSEMIEIVVCDFSLNKATLHVCVRSPTTFRYTYLRRFLSNQSQLGVFRKLGMVGVTEVQTEQQNKEERWSQWLWILHGCWC